MSSKFPTARQGLGRSFPFRTPSFLLFLRCLVYVGCLRTRVHTGQPSEVQSQSIVCSPLGVSGRVLSRFSRGEYPGVVSELLSVPVLGRKAPPAFWHSLADLQQGGVESLVGSGDSASLAVMRR